MKVLVASDIHGSIEYFDILLKRIEAEHPDRIIILGDLYPYGGGSEFSLNYIADHLNSMPNLSVTLGNCDYPEDHIFDFQFQDKIVTCINKKIFYFCHGNINNYNNPPAMFDCLIYGHEHVGYIKERDGKIYVNAGSIGQPRYGSPRSYVIINDEEIILKNLNGEVINYISY